MVQDSLKQYKNVQKSYYDKRKKLGNFLGKIPILNFWGPQLIRHLQKLI